MLAVANDLAVRILDRMLLYFVSLSFLELVCTFTDLSGDQVMAPFGRTARNLAVNTALLRAVLGMGLLVRLIRTVTLTVLIKLAVHLLTQTTVAENSSITLFIATETTLSFVSFETSLLSWRLLGATTNIGQSSVSSGFLAVLFVVDEIPALRKMSTQILNNWTGDTQGNIRPSHTRALGPIELVIFPVADVLEVCVRVSITGRLKLSRQCYKTLTKLSDLRYQLTHHTSVIKVLAWEDDPVDIARMGISNCVLVGVPSAVAQV